jgi:surface polysaccharide O-acyltransferase-like enzyme
MVGLALTGRSILTETALGACLLAAALLAPWQGRLINLMGRLGQCAYGIYLSHVAFVLVPETALGRSRESIGLCVLIAIFLFAVAASTITSLGLRRWKLTRWLCA